MSEITECVQALQDELDEHDNKSFSRLSMAEKKQIGRRRSNNLRSPRQKFCQRWVVEFPWLKPDKITESLGYCKVCDKVLVCKKSHLERHQKSYKHQRLEGFDVLTQENIEELEEEDDATNELDVDAVLDDSTETLETTAPEFLECGKQDIDGGFEYETSIEVDSEHKMDTQQLKKQQHSVIVKKNLPRIKNMMTQLQKPQIVKLDRYKLLKRIDRDRDELNEYYYARQKPTNTTNYQQIAPQRDTFDLFFDSMSALAKTFPPKLAAEAKSRVSQIMAEFELRSICERETQGNVAVTNETDIVVASTTHDVLTNDAQDSADDMSQIVFTFQK